MCESIVSTLANLLARDRLLRRSPCLIKYVGHHTSRQFACERLDQPPELHRYPSTQGNRLQFHIHATVALFKPLHNQCRPDVSRSPILWGNMLARLAIICVLLYTDKVCRDASPVGGWPSDLNLLICIHRRSRRKGLLHCKYIRSNEVPPSKHIGSGALAFY
jgi:hypothetical protein